VTQATRVRLGAPNEERFGFSQAVTCGTTARVSGQVGKDNRTGEMVHPTDRRLQVERAVANVREAAGLAGAGPDGVAQLTAFVVGPVADSEPLLREALGDRPPATTVVRIPALSHDEYLAELSAVATTEPPDVMERLDPPAAGALDWAPAAVVASGDVHLSAVHGHGPDPAAALGEALGAASEVLRRAGCDGLGDVLAEHVFVVRAAAAGGFTALADAHRDAYAGAAPASTLVLVDELPGGATVAVSLTARRPSPKGRTA
jgi:enamine deaminase RidA (YjgF/YER057c/UK114 family)